MVAASSCDACAFLSSPVPRRPKTLLEGTDHRHLHSQSISATFGKTSDGNPSAWHRLASDTIGWHRTPSAGIEHYRLASNTPVALCLQDRVEGEGPEEGPEARPARPTPAPAGARRAGR
ncbi:hypothetical protein MAPG_02310 [Magnaporthiopsis poae ATCC 64411]|uniref:Uncharacterized protein n=1 Tax=Magnaporthiopsis poae (strain ATCC 64411 / 73-15) TaxID=644358 RepID=A0A0C4DR11_MAGP6|nr:hypothetical protein MAPG_02310 [Magnaporthiopsis poae ATCC 64411]